MAMWLWPQGGNSIWSEAEREAAARARDSARARAQAGSPYIWRNRQTVLNRLVCAVAGATLTEDVAAYALAPTRRPREMDPQAGGHAAAVQRNAHSTSGPQARGPLSLGRDRHNLLFNTRASTFLSMGLNHMGLNHPHPLHLHRRSCIFYSNLLQPRSHRSRDNRWRRAAARP